jgi:hypothetical protein
MIFDLRGKRRRTVQATYLTLAVLMGAGLVFFGIGSSVSGGLSDLLGGGNGKDQANTTVQKNIAAAEKKLKTNPSDPAALAALVRGHYQLATQKADANGNFTSGARAELQATTDAWTRYAAAAKKVDKGIASTAIQSYTGLVQLTKDPQDQKPLWQGAAGAAETLTQGSKSFAPFVRLVQYASLAGETRKADLAGKRAVELAPKKQKKQVQQLVDQAKSAAASQGQQPPGQAPTQTPAP